MCWLRSVTNGNTTNCPPSVAFPTYPELGVFHVVVMQREAGVEVFKDLSRMCTAFVLLIKPFVFWRPPCRCRRGLFTKDGDQPAPCLIFNSCFIRDILFSFFSADLVVVWLTSGISKMKETRLDRAVVMYWLTIRHLLETCLAMKNITFINCIPANRFWKVLDKS